MTGGFEAVRHICQARTPISPDKNHLRTWIRRQDASLGRRLAAKPTTNLQLRVMDNDIIRILKHLGIVPGFSSYFFKFRIFEIPEHPRAVP